MISTSLRRGWAGSPTASGRGDFSGGGFQRQTITASETNAEFLLSDDIATSHPTDRAAAGGPPAADGRLLAPVQQPRRFDDRLGCAARHGTAAAPRDEARPATTRPNRCSRWASGRSTTTRRSPAPRATSGIRCSRREATPRSIPSISGRIDLTRAAGMKSDKLNSAVVHGGLSRVGGAVSPLLLTNIFTPPTDSAATVSASPNLSPEMTTSLELGGSLSFLRNRLGVDVTLYDDQTTGVILGVTSGATRSSPATSARCRTRAWSCRPRSSRSARRRARSGRSTRGWRRTRTISTT